MEIENYWRPFLNAFEEKVLLFAVCRWQSSGFQFGGMEKIIFPLVANWDI